MDYWLNTDMYLVNIDDFLIFVLVVDHIDSNDIAKNMCVIYKFLILKAAMCVKS